MALPDLVGNTELRTTFGRARLAGQLPQSILLHGPSGAGKERLGLWIAQLLVCEETEAEPCGRCRPCRLTLRLEHPDVHWFFPLPRPESTSPEKLRERLEEHRASELQQWRENPMRIPEHERAPAHFLASVRTIQQIASLRPAAGSHKVFVIGDAELMVPQESSPDAANAFLKLLEEPPPSTTLVLTSSQPGALLPTIRSRTPGIRVLPPTEAEIARLLVATGLADEAKASAIARRSLGSVRRAIRLATSPGGAGGDPERIPGKGLLIAALSSGAVPRLAAAHDRKPAGARADLVGELESLALWLRDLAAVAFGASDRVSDPDAITFLTRAIEMGKISPEAAIDSIALVSTARDLAFRNVNPQLIVADLLAKLQVELGAAGGRNP